MKINKCYGLIMWVFVFEYEQFLFIDVYRGIS